MKVLPFALLATALLLDHAGMAQTTPPPSRSMAPGVSAPNPALGATPAVPTAAPTRHIAVSILTEKDLMGQNGSELGDIEGVVENTAEKKSFVVVSRGGFLGFFETEYLVPIDQISVVGDRIVAKDMTQAQLESKTLFDSSSATYRSLESTQTVSIPEQR